MATSYSVEDIESILESELNGDTKRKSERSDKPEPKIEEPKFVAPTLAATEWESAEWEGVVKRQVPASEGFGLPLPNVLLTQYRGFESFPQLLVPSIPDVYEPCLDALAALCLGAANDLKTMLVGDTGTGKTSLIEFFAHKLGRPFVRTVFDATTDDQKLFGSLEVKSVDGASETYFNRSDLTKGLAFPTVTCLDEFSRANAEQTMLVNPLLDRRQVTVTSHDDVVSERVVAHEDWLVFGTDNTNGSGDDMDLYNSSNVLDEAIRNRFDIYSRVPYMSESAERKVIMALSGDVFTSEQAKQLAHFSALCHKGYADRKIRTAFSVRNLKAIIAMVMSGVSMKQAIDHNFTQRVAKAEQADISEMIRGIWG